MTGAGKKKFILPLAVLLVLMVIAFSGYLYVNRLMEDPPVLTDIHIDTKAAMKLNLLEQVFKKNGITELVLKASTATLLKEEEKALLTDVNVVYFTEDGKEITLTSDHGIWHTATNDMTVTDNVIVRHETYTLRTDKLHYEKKPHIILSDARVRLEDENSVIEADAMILELKTNRLVLQGRVEGAFSEKSDIL